MENFCSEAVPCVHCSGHGVSMEAPDTQLEVDCSRSYDEILRLERNLLATSKSKGPFDPSVRRLRSSIRDSYEALILHDCALAQSLEIEQALWRLHYREIEAFRVRIRKLLVAKPDHERDCVQGRGRKRKKSNRQDPLLRLLTAVKSFLGEATGFFHDLLIKIRLRNGVTGTFGDTDRLADENMRDEIRCCMIMCHRLLINLGDLARYKELYVVLNPSARDWSVAANHYKQAAYIWPASGQPYNQLAVLCSYSGHVLMALYLYCRSLGVSVPYTTAWDNLKLLAEKNKQCIAKASLRQSESDLSSICGVKSMACLRDMVVEKGAAEGVSNSCQWFVMDFVKLVGILLTQSSSEELEKAVNLILRNVKPFLFAQLDVALHREKCLNIEGSAPLALQILVILIFCLHHIIGLQSTVDQSFLSITLKFAFKFAALSVEVAEKSNICSNFPVAVIFMEWLGSEHKILQIAGEKSVELSYVEFCEKIMAFDKTLINKTLVDGLPEGKESFRRNKDNLLEVSRKAQWEDHELLGFIPLASTHLNLDFSKPIPTDRDFDFARYLCWKLRYTAALQKLNETYQESNAHDSSSVEKENVPPMNSVEANHTKSTPENFLLGVHPAPSLKEWVEKSCFPTNLPCSSAFTKQVDVQCLEKGDGVDVVEGFASAPVVKTLGRDCTPENFLFNLVPTFGDDSCTLMVSPTIVSEPQKCNYKHLSFDKQQGALPRNQARKDGLPSARANEILASPSRLMYKEGQSMKNLSHNSECCLASSPAELKSDKNPKQFVGQKAENLLVPSSTLIDNTGMELSRNTSVLSVFSQEQLIKDRNCHDDLTHVKAAANMQSPLGADVRKHAPALMTYTKLPGGRQKSYVTQNPFVLRIKKCVD